MIQLVLLLVLFAASKSEGLPIPTLQRNGSLDSSLFTLENSCKNPFLVNQIKSIRSDCNTTARPPYSELQLQCLMFYDINSQLCDAVAASKMALLDEHLVSINDTLDVQVLCKESRLWEVVDLPNYPQFKPTIEKVFKNMFTCAKVCGVPEVTSQDSNFYCKYFRWGLSMLNTINKAVAPRPEGQATQEHEEAVKKSAPMIQDLIGQAAQGQSAPNILQQARNQSSLNNSGTTTHNNIVKSPNEIITNLKAVQIAPAPTAPNSEVSEEGKDIQVDPDQDPNPAEDQAEEPKKEVPAITRPQQIIGQESKNVVEPKPSPSVEVDNTDEDGMVKPVPAVIPSVVMHKPDKQKEVKTQIAQGEVPTNVADNGPKVNSVKAPEGDVEEDYRDADDGKEGLTDMQGGDDGDDTMLTDLDNNLEQTQAKISANKYDTDSLKGERVIDINPEQTQANLVVDNNPEQTQATLVLDNNPEQTQAKISANKNNTEPLKGGGGRGGRWGKSLFDDKLFKGLFGSKTKTYTSTYQDGFPDGNGNFFPFFLTTIILVVLLYVLFHNKNKVSQVIMGLLVEGRSGARGRRGSRGHAYRRLDTLESAMSAPSAKAPEKIIY